MFSAISTGINIPIKDWYISDADYDLATLLFNDVI